MVHLGRGVHAAKETVHANCATLRSEPVVIDWDVERRRVRMVHCPKHVLQSSRSKRMMACNPA